MVELYHNFHKFVKIFDDLIAQDIKKRLGWFFMRKIFIGVLAGVLVALVGCGVTAGNGDGIMTEVVEAAEREPITYPQKETTKPVKTASKAQPQQEWKVLQNGSYTTKFDAAQKNRTHNLDVAAKTLDGTIIEPNDILSFNEIIGLATAEKGYLSAKIFIDGEEVEGLGGGICQLSSTLYNAAKQAGLEIVERHAHSRRVYYVPEGKDAATAYGGVDLKIKNNTKKQVKVAARIEGDQCIVEIKTKL